MANIWTWRTCQSYWGGCALTCQLAGHTVTIQKGSFSEDIEQVGTEYDDWIEGEYHRVVHPYGKLRSWTFTCFEETAQMPWENSPAFRFQELIEGDSVDFILAFAGHTFAGLAYIRHVKVWYDANMNIRYYDLEVREA